MLHGKKELEKLVDEFKNMSSKEYLSLFESISEEEPKVTPNYIREESVKSLKSIKKGK